MEGNNGNNESKIQHYSVFLRKIREMDLEIESIQTEQESAVEEGRRACIIMLKAKRKRNHEVLFQNIRDIEGVAYVEGL